ncbi:MAG: hypothetical protein Kow00114_30990 [Kiloniellaceae bacterium]
MRIVLVTGADRLSGLAARRLLAEEGRYDVVAVVRTITPLRRIWSLARTAARNRSLYYFVYMAAESMLPPVTRPPVKAPSILDHARRRGRPVIQARNVNDPEVVDFIRGASPDVVLSLRPGQIFRLPFIRQVPPILNLHCTKLPKYRGVAGVLQALAAGERELGISLHGVVSEAVDAGPLYAQSVIADAPGSSLFSQTCRLYQAAADVVIAGLEACQAGRTIHYDEAEATLYSWPGPAPRGALRRLNRPFISWSDLQ